MALKGDRYVVTTDISFFMDEVATRGGIASISTIGSGAALDQSQALVTYAANSSGKVPMGLLLGDMVDVDLTRYKLNQHREETQKGGKVTLMLRGWVRTNMLDASSLRVAGPAYLCSSGLITTSRVNVPANPVIGTCMANDDEDGYAKIWVNLP